MGSMEEAGCEGETGVIQRWTSRAGLTGGGLQGQTTRTEPPDGGLSASSYLLTLAEEEVMEVWVVLHELQQRTSS